MSFSEIIVSKLGTPSDPFGWGDALVVVVALAVIAAVVGLEWLIGRALRKLACYIWSRIVTEYRKANKP
jgi:hypothetical protein